MENDLIDQLPPADGDNGQLPGNPAEDQHDELEKKYAELQEKYELLKKESLLDKISRETGCTDPEYLEFCARRQGIDSADSEKMRQFARELAAASPGCFNARITPGSSAACTAALPPASGVRAGEFSGDRISMIALCIDNAPDAVSR